ncbi:Lipopolysaccharide-induced tumor necrosis factor-alpha factor [Orchesella cincta]|uniref:Lipopolysaccharide-induced tumor necrosis factor-alpha factor n=1 Tax=Orchesella cincta TaxID=48709 RepID=A0A1D2MMA0_ORCCI|nr:Lipopolysaccharide-induced tumor necrosis factor-alpha factor [Orchesella cincta]
MSAPPYIPDSSKGPPGYPPPYDAGVSTGPPQPGFHQPHPQVGTATVHVLTTQPQPVLIVGPGLGTHNAQMTCPHCRSEIQTKTDKKPSIVAWISAAVCCLVGCWLGCCLIPLCVDSCMDVDHRCPNCNAHLGTHRSY